MVVGDSLPSPIMAPIQPQQRLVEGDNDIEVLHIQPPVLPPMPGLPSQPPPPGGREVEGESRPPGPAPGQSQPPLPREPIIDGESQPGPAPARPMVPGESIFALGNYPFYIHNIYSRSNHFIALGLSVSSPSPPVVMSGPVIPPPASVPGPEVTSAASAPINETRSEAAGSDRRDVDMMGPPTGGFYSNYFELAVLESSALQCKC